MTRFHRASHWRTNHRGTTFQVRGHEVTRDNHSFQQPSDFATTVVKPFEDVGVIHANARCPECESRVFFLKAVNGGRVFLDSLGPEWRKHPCMVPEDAEMRQIDPPEGSAAEEPQVVRGNVWLLGLLPGIPGTIARLGREEPEGIIHLRGNIELGSRYQQDAWLSDDEVSLTLITEDGTRVTVPVEGCDPPDALTDKARLAASATMRGRLKAFSNRIPGLSSATSVSHSSCGTFIGGMVGATRIAIIPVPIEHGHWGARPFHDLSRYLRNVSQAAFRVLDRHSPLKPNLVEEDQVVFVLDNPIASYVDDQGFDDPDMPTTEGQHFTDADLDGISESLAGAGLRHFRWYDLSAQTAVVIERVPTRISTLLAMEASFCRARWSRDVSGRWRQIEKLFKDIGAGSAFDILHRELMSIGWVPEHRGELRTSVIYTPSSGEEPFELQVLALLSGNGTIACIVNADEDKPVEEKLTILTEAEIPAFVKRVVKRMR